jgi:hypothetical protein
MDRLSQWASLISDAALGLFALWQGIELLGERRLRALLGAGSDAVQKNVWYLLRKLTAAVLIIAIAGFALAIALKIVVLVGGSQ